MSDAQGNRTTAAFGIDALVDSEASPSSARAAGRRALRRDLHWWIGSALLLFALPMLAWQAILSSPGRDGSAGTASASAAGSPVRPPDSTTALDRTIDDQAGGGGRNVVGGSPPLPLLPPLPVLPAASERMAPHALRTDRAVAGTDGPVTARSVLAPPAGDLQPSRQEMLAAEQERRLAEARSSPLLALGGGGAVATAQPTLASLPGLLREAVPAAGHGAPGVAPTVALPLPPAEGRSDLAWIEQSRTRGMAEAGPAPALRPAPGGLAVLEGTVIPAVLLTEINSDLPGTLVAQVTQDVWDSVHGSHLLIPMGSRLVGEYNSDVRPGQERVLAAFRRLILPDGASIDLLGTQAADAQGRSGLNDRVDRHFWTMFGSSFVVAALASLVQRREAQPSTVIVVPGANSAGGSALSSAAGSVLVETSRAILGRTRNMSPTLLISQGHRFSLIVQRTFLLVRQDAGSIEPVSRYLIKQP